MVLTSNNLLWSQLTPFSHFDYLEYSRSDIFGMNPHDRLVKLEKWSLVLVNINFTASMLSGFVIFSVLGYMANQERSNLDDFYWYERFWFFDTIQYYKDRQHWWNDKKAWDDRWRSCREWTWSRLYCLPKSAEVKILLASQSELKYNF